MERRPGTLSSLLAAFASRRTGAPPSGLAQRGIWSADYAGQRERHIVGSLSDASLMDAFAAGGPLPAGYGVGVDERCVEIPWLLSRLTAEPGTLLDAGSTLNHAYLLDQPALARRRLHILTLAPEENCFWRRGIGYLYEDLRRLPMRDGLYDEVACISTLEHVGCDNSGYTGDPAHREDRPGDFETAVREMARVLRPGGRLYVTVPYGAPSDCRALRVFDASRLAQLRDAFGPARDVSEAFYLYAASGWQAAREEDCRRAEYVAWLFLPPEAWPCERPMEPDLAVAARAVACVRLIKA